MKKSGRLRLTIAVTLSAALALSPLPGLLPVFDIMPEAAGTVATVEDYTESVEASGSTSTEDSTDTCTVASDTDYTESGSDGDSQGSSSVTESGQDDEGTSDSTVTTGSTNTTNTTDTSSLYEQLEGMLEQLEEYFVYDGYTWELSEDDYVENVAYIIEFIAEIEAFVSDNGLELTEYESGMIAACSESAQECLGELTAAEQLAAQLNSISEGCAEADGLGDVVLTASVEISGENKITVPEGVSIQVCDEAVLTVCADAVDAFMESEGIIVFYYGTSLIIPEEFNPDNELITFIGTEDDDDAYLQIWDEEGAAQINPSYNEDWNDIDYCPVYIDGVTIPTGKTVSIPGCYIMGGVIIEDGAALCIVDKASTHTATCIDGEASFYDYGVSIEEGGLLYISTDNLYLAAADINVNGGTFEQHGVHYTYVYTGNYITVNDGGRIFINDAPAEAWDEGLDCESAIFTLEDGTIYAEDAYDYLIGSLGYGTWIEGGYEYESADGSTITYYYKWTTEEDDSTTDDDEDGTADGTEEVVTEDDGMDDSSEEDSLTDGSGSDGTDDDEKDAAGTGSDISISDTEDAGDTEGRAVADSTADDAGTGDAADTVGNAADNYADGSGKTSTLSGTDEEEVSTYIVIFDANGGTVAEKEYETDENGQLLVLPTPSRSGYTFNGWYTEETGGEKVTAGTVFEEDTIVYAHWTKTSTSSGSGSSGSSRDRSSSGGSGTAVYTSGSLSGGTVALGTVSTAGSDGGESSGSPSVTADGVRLETNAIVGDNISYTNYQGQVIVGDTALSFVTGETGTAGLPAAVVETINGINAGADLGTVGTGLDLNGYKTLMSTCALRTASAETNLEVRSNVQVPLYIPNLTDELNDISILFYDNYGGWKLLPPDAIDFGKKQLLFTVPNSGTLTVIYR